MSKQDENQHPPFWHSARNRKLMWILLYGSCALTLVAEFFVHAEHHFHFMEFSFSSAVLGFVVCSLMIISAKALGYLLKQKESYYDNDERV